MRCTSHSTFSTRHNIMLMSHSLYSIHYRQWSPAMMPIKFITQQLKSSAYRYVINRGLNSKSLQESQQLGCFKYVSMLQRRCASDWTPKVLLAGEVFEPYELSSVVTIRVFILMQSTVAMMRNVFMSKHLQVIVSFESSSHSGNSS